MPRSTPKVYAHRRHKKVLKFTKGQYGTRSKLFRRANEAMLKSLFYAYRDRRNRKRDFRSLWIQRINAAARQNGLNCALATSASRAKVAASLAAMLASTLRSTCTSAFFRP